MHISLSGDGPLYIQLYRALQSAILSGQFVAGERLPPSRLFASDLGVSRNVVLGAYEQLLAEGYLKSQQGAGTFVAETLPETGLKTRPPQALNNRQTAAANKRLPAPTQQAIALYQQQLKGVYDTEVKVEYDFKYSAVTANPSSLKQWQRVLGKSARDFAIGYGDVQGEPELRKALARYLTRHRGVQCTAAEVIIVNGSQQGLDLVARTLLNPNDRVAMEEPGYRGARQVFSIAKAELVPMFVDEQGANPETLNNDANNIRLAYITPSHQFPCGSIMSLQRRLSLLEWAQRQEAYVLEDDYDGEFRFSGRPIEAVQGLDCNQRTLYLGTFSKIMWPALRLGYLIVPEPLHEALLAMRWISYRHPPILEQLAMASFINEGHFERHLRRMRTLYSRRHNALIQAIEYYFGKHVQIIGTHAGLHILAWLKGMNNKQLQQLSTQTLRKQVRIYSATDLYLSPPNKAGLILGYACLDEDEIRQGIKILHQCWTDLGFSQQ